MRELGAEGEASNVQTAKRQRSYVRGRRPAARRGGQCLARTTAKQTMNNLGHNSELTARGERVIVLSEANSGLPLKGDFERMARRRFQNPKPFREGAWWWMLVYEDTFAAGKCARRKKRVKLAPATMKEREVQKIAAEYLRPINQGLEAIGSATNFATYVNGTYIPVVLPLMATTTRSRSLGIINNYLAPGIRQVVSARCGDVATSAVLQRHGV